MVAHIKKDATVLPRIGALREVKALFLDIIIPNIDNHAERISNFSKFLLFFSLKLYEDTHLVENLQMNLEYFAIDSQVSLVNLLELHL